LQARAQTRIESADGGVNKRDEAMSRSLFDITRAPISISSMNELMWRRCEALHPLKSSSCKNLFSINSLQDSCGALVQCKMR
jgi:hypothetical protein